MKQLFLERLTCNIRFIKFFASQKVAGVSEEFVNRIPAKGRKKT